jgi:hypothetical protein
MRRLPEQTQRVRAAQRCIHREAVENRSVEQAGG